MGEQCLERDIEKYLVARCKELGILCEKFTSPQRRSVPDRILTYDGIILFLELKATGKKPSAAQNRDHANREAHGARVRWVDSKDGVDRVLRLITQCLRGPD